jgi:hypothetical protein
MPRPDAPPRTLRRQFSRLHISQHDLAEAEEYFAACSSERTEIIQRALLTAGIIAYARPFTQNEREPDTDATPSISTSILTELEPEEKSLHDRVVSLRHQAVAHSSYETRPIQNVEIQEHGFSVESTYFDVNTEGLDHQTLSRMAGKLKLACRLRKLELTRLLGHGASERPGGWLTLSTDA